MMINFYGDVKMTRYAVLDLEMCRVPRGIRRDSYDAPQEIIQIGAVLLDENYNEIDSFMTYVKPEFGVIDRFVSTLTGISREDVSSAPGIAEALERFVDWLPEDATLVTWSENDVYQLDIETELKAIDLPQLYPYLDDYVDCQIIFSDKMNNDRDYRLSEALLIANVEFDENIHDALVDARNTALLFKKTQLEETLVLSPYLMSADELASSRRDSLI